jgi:integrase
VFPDRRGRPLERYSTHQLLKTMGRDITTHGFRSTFRDWCAECTSYPRELAEMSLAHSVRDATEAAYARSDMLEKRREMMAAWARHCDNAGGNVVPIRATA